MDYRILKLTSHISFLNTELGKKESKQEVLYKSNETLCNSELLP